MIEFPVFAVIGYLLGSISFGVLVGRLFSNVDVREHGSGNTGMTNVLRTLGPPAAAFVLLADMGKAALAVILAKLLVGAPGVEVTAALAAIVGHNWPVFLGFKGGRGTSSGWGALIVLSPISALVATLLGGPTAAVSRYMSLGSLVGTVSGSATIVVLALFDAVPGAYAWYGLMGTALIVARHRDSIQRLLKGEERKVGRPTADAPRKTKPARGRQRWPRSV